MALRLTEKSDIKIFILYLLSRVERPLDFVTLHDICVQDEFINTFDFMDEFYELQKIKAITVEKNDDGSEKVRITPKGRDTAQTMKDAILPEILDHAVRSALQLISFRTRGLTPRASIDEAGAGRYTFTCSVSGEDGVYMETKLLLDSRKQAERMLINFDERSEFIYRGMMALLSGDINYLAESWCDDLASVNDEQQ
ncbi:MAG: DUF4364 family protein [Clostridia bacterium]|nr:DUF4364 family protein [Clostridia bacterium]